MILQTSRPRFGRCVVAYSIQWTICYILKNPSFHLNLIQVVFEPDPKDNNKTTSHVATCGGNSICIIDVNSGTVLMKYKHKDIKENFYTLAWTTLTLDDEKTNILASQNAWPPTMLARPGTPTDPK